MSAGAAGTVPPSRSRLAAMALVRFTAGFVLLSTDLFLTAGTIHWWQAWAFMGVLFGSIAVMFVWLLAYDTALLERRLRGMEKRREQRIVQAVGSVVYLLVLIIPGFDHRYGWSDVPVAAVIAADALVLAGYVLFAWVLRVNRWASRLVEVAQGQQVVTRGPYAFVRHPMYSAILVMFTATPVALGSWWALLPALLLGPVLAARIVNEEALLRGELPGYAAYTTTTRYRLVPGVW
jgi:protein-S-isoprenylcysteine O-methyltransferase Ste14